MSNMINERQPDAEQPSKAIMSSKSRPTDQMEAQSSFISRHLRPPATSDSAETSVTNSENRERSGNFAACNNSAKSASFHLSTVSPGPDDILCGRGLHIMNRKGNLSLHLLVNKYREKYLEATRRAKAEIIRHIVEDIKSTGARFLGRIEGGDDDRWAVVDDKTASKKVSHALRLRKDNHGKKFLKATELQQSMDSTAAPIAAHTPPQVPEAPSSEQRDLDNAPPTNVFCPTLSDMRLPYCPIPQFQLQPMMVFPNHTPTLFHQVPLLSQPQLLSLLLNRSGYGSMMLDPRLVANPFATALATMGPTAHQARSSLDERLGAAQLSSSGSKEETRKQS